MKKLAVCIITLLAATAALAKPTPAAVQKAIPGLPPVLAVNTTPMRGIFEVEAENSIFFVDASLTHIIGGEMFNAKTHESVTQPTIERVQKRMLAKAIETEKNTLKTLDLNDAIVEKKGSGERVLYVFTDPLCPYCRRLETELDKLKDVTIYRFLVDFKGPAAAKIIENAWCSKDKLHAWKDAMSGKTIPSATCSTPLDHVKDLVPKLHIRGTPTMIKPDNSRRDGALPAETLEKWLSEPLTK